MARRAIHATRVPCGITRTRGRGTPDARPPSISGERSHVSSQLWSRRVLGRDARPGSQAQSQPANPSSETALFRGLQYRLVGPSRGGRVTTVTGVPSQPKTFYMGVASGGLLRTTDGGATWVPIGDGKIPLGSMGAIAVADSDPNVIYVGTGSDGVRSNVSTGRGVYKSIGWWRDVAVRRSLRCRADRRRAYSSDESRHRLGRCQR